MPTAQTLDSTIASHLLDGLIALKQGDFTHRLDSHLTGIEGKLADTKLWVHVPGSNDFRESRLTVR